MVEYGIVVALIAVVSVVVIGALGLDVYGFLDSVQVSFTDGGPLPPSR